MKISMESIIKKMSYKVIISHYLSTKDFNIMIVQLKILFNVMYNVINKFIYIKSTKLLLTMVL